MKPAISPVLVLYRVGADQRIGGWAATPRAARDWDLVLSPYEDVPQIAQWQPDEILPLPGGKWEALHQILTARPDLLEGRRHIWLPDDDLEGDAATLARFFALAREKGLHLAQPALSADSAFSHFVTVRHLLTDVRYTNFVELMAPLMTPDLLRAALPEMAGRAGAKGLDYYWSRLVPAPRARRIAVVDAAVMAHRRPLGGALQVAMAKAGRDLGQERDRFFAARLGPRYPRSVSTGHDGLLGQGAWGRVSVSAAGALTLALSPALWHRAALVRAAKTLGAQLRGRAEDPPPDGGADRMQAP